MCGIFGFYSNKNKEYFDKKKINLIFETLKHRGPDQKNFQYYKNLFFLHTRLSIIGLENDFAIQPKNSSKSIMVFNGEIYNYKELNELLINKNINISSSSDTETLFACFNEFGFEETLKKIDGIFSIVYFDKIKNQLFLARDRIGEKSLYWAKDKKKFIFSSEIKAIIKSNFFSTFKPNLNKIGELFVNGKIYCDQTSFNDIYEIEPGKFIKIDIKNNRIIKNDFYWKIENFKQIKKNKIKDKFEEQLKDAVKTRLTSDVPVAALVSGGLDSSTLIYQILNIGNDKSLNIFFAKNKLKKINEFKFVKELISHLKNEYLNKEIKIYSIKQDIEKYFNNQKKITYFNDEPIMLYNSHLVYTLSNKIRNTGFKVVFSGEGADELLYGYNRFERTKNLIKNESNSEKKLEHIYFGASLKDIDNIENITNHNFVDQIKSSKPWQWLNKYKNLDLNTTQLLFSQKYRLQSLLQRQDRMCMANSVESRAPFLSPKFVKFINSMPFSYKYDNFKNIRKKILRNVMQNKIPKIILNRPKVGFETDFSYSMQKKTFLGHIKRLIFNSNSFSSNYLNKKAIIDILKDDKKIKSNLNIIKMIYSIETWHKVFFENKR
tara:strand:+ start:121 stop:1935 length:1815 start_codon:yes stop_codon:yes gene_type:complete